MKDLICWLDLETTGLDPVKDRILEVGAIVTDWNLEAITNFHRVVYQPREVLDMMRSEVVEMHRNSGLLQDIEGPVACAEDMARDRLMKWLTDFSIRESMPSAGFTPGFDRAFLAVQWPEVHRWLNHRSLDVSTLKQLRRRWRPALREEVVLDGGHRALADCREALGWLRAHRQWLT